MSMRNSLQVPQKADAQGLIKCLECGVKLLEIENILDKANVLGVVGNFLSLLVVGQMEHQLTLSRAEVNNCVGQVVFEKL